MAYMRDATGRRLDSFQVAPMLRAAVQGRPFTRDPEPVMTTPPTVGAATTTSSLTGTVINWKPVQYVSGSIQVATDYFTITGARDPIISDAVNRRDYVRFTSLTNSSSSGADTRFAHYNVDFMHDGDKFELRFYQTSGASIRVWVDDQLVSTAPISLAVSANNHGYVLFTFASRAVRHIRVETGGDSFGGVLTPVADTITRHQFAENTPLCLIMADSYGEGAGGVSAHSSFVRRFARRMGWPRTISSSVGGTGYLNTGTGTYPFRTKFRDRLANDVIPFAPDIVIWTGGHNDTAFSQAAIQAEALACYEAVAAALPNCRQIVTAPLWGPGPESYLANPAPLIVRDALQAAATAAGLTFLDCLEQPLDQSISTTLSSTLGVGSTSMSVPVIIPPGSYVNIDNRNEYRRVLSVSGGGPFAHVLNKAMVRQHNSGAPVVRVGQCLWTGTGRVGATTGDGNSDFTVSSDAVHPSKEGQDLIGDWLASNVARVLAA